VALFALGNMQRIARQAAESLSCGWLRRGNVNARFFKPLDAGCHEFFGPRRGRRRHTGRPRPDGRLRFIGPGALQRERHHDTLVRLGWPDKFIEHATTVDYLREKHGLTAASLVSRVKTALSDSTRRAWANLESPEADRAA